MSEPNPNGENGNGWKMPEPVFRSSEGRKPGELPPDPQGDIPTEPGFTDEDSETDPLDKQTVRPTSGDRKTRHSKKKRGCLKSFATVVIVLAASLLAIVVTVVYLLFFYRPPADGTF